MRTLNEREQKLGRVILVVAFLCIWYSVTARQSRTLRIRQVKLSITEDKLRSAQGLLQNQDHAVAAVTDNQLSMILLKDLTSPKEAENIRVVQVERTTEKSFKMTVEGRFTEVMRFTSFLERQDSKFSVGGLALIRMEAGMVAPKNEEAEHPPGEVRGTFSISTKG